MNAGGCHHTVAVKGIKNLLCNLLTCAPLLQPRSRVRNKLHFGVPKNHPNDVGVGGHHVCWLGPLAFNHVDWDLEVLPHPDEDISSFSHTTILRPLNCVQFCRRLLSIELSSVHLLLIQIDEGRTVAGELTPSCMPQDHLKRRSSGFVDGFVVESPRWTSSPPPVLP
jgi:hypothetical protein